jgi:ferredoxin
MARKRNELSAVTSTTSHIVSLETPSGEKSIRAEANQIIWDAASAQGIVLPAICHQGRCLTCAGRLIGEGKVDNSRADSYFPQDAAEGFVLLCTAVACTDVRIRTHQEAEMRKHRLMHGLPAPYA